MQAGQMKVAAKKMKFSFEDFLSKYEQIRIYFQIMNVTYCRVIFVSLWDLSHVYLTKLIQKRFWFYYHFAANILQHRKNPILKPICFFSMMVWTLLTPKHTTILEISITKKRQYIFKQTWLLFQNENFCIIKIVVLDLNIS